MLCRLAAILSDTPKFQHMTIPIKITTFLISLVFLSCGQEKKEPPKEKWRVKYDKQKQLDTLNENEAANIATKLNAIQSKDNDLKFTYQIQEILKDSSKLISVIGNITDILQKNGNYLFKVYGTYSKKYCLFEISVSPEMFHKIFNQLDLKYSLHKGCFIFKPTSIKSSSLLKIDSKVSGGETIDDAETSLTYDFIDEIIFFKGNLVGYYMYKKLPKGKD